MLLDTRGSNKYSFDMDETIEQQTLLVCKEYIKGGRVPPNDQKKKKSQLISREE